MDTTNWKWYSVQELFHPQKCKCSNATELLSPGNDIAYIGAKKSVNGVMSYVERVDNLVTKGNCIVFIGDGQGSVGYCLYQPYDFIGSTTLLAGYNDNLNQYTAQFLIGVLDCERYRYSFGRKYNKQAIEKTSILLPAKDNDTPDWQYMEDYVKNTLIPQLPEQARAVWEGKYDDKPINQTKLDLFSQKWMPFLPKDIFDSIEIGRSYDLNSLEYKENGVRYLCRGITNNGIQTTVDGDRLKQYSKQYISVVMVGVPSIAFYQERPFVCSQNILLLGLQNLNKYIAQFLCGIIEREKYRYSYGRTLSKKIFESLPISLPAVANPDGTYSPDWQFMEDYIKSLPYSKNI